MNIKHVVLIRKDLELTTGLISAQVAHIAMERFRVALTYEDKSDSTLSPIDLEWLKAPYLYVHAVPNWEWLRYYSEKARMAKIEVTEWKDTLYMKSSETQQQAFENVLVGVSLGPIDSDKIKAVIGDLPLL